MIVNLLSRILVSMLLTLNIVESACINPLPLGLVTSGIKDVKITSGGTIYEDYNATEINLRTGKGWCATNESHPFLIIDFNSMVTVSKIATQGIDHNGTKLFTSKYRLQFGYTESDWYDYKAEGTPLKLHGNNDAKTVVNNTLDDTMARYIKMIPIFGINQTVTCMKMEIYGCRKALAPNVKTSPETLTLKSEQDGKIQCIAAGQIGMNAKWIKKANDMMASGSLHSNSTNGILYNETRLLNIKKPSIMDDKTYGDSCFVNMSEAVVICEKNYSCRAEYTFDKDIATQKQVKVLLKKGLSLTVIVNNGDNSPIYTKVKETKIIACSARSQDPVTVQWYNNVYSEWTKQTSVSKDETQGHLNLFKEVNLSLAPKASDVIGKLSCKKSMANGNAIECFTKFGCNAQYQRNTSMVDQKQIDVHYVVNLPGKPAYLQEECGSRTCTITWSHDQIGDIPKESIKYDVNIKDESNVIRKATVTELSFPVESLVPNRRYIVEIRAHVRSFGNKVWQSEAAERTFKTLPIAPTSLVKFKETKRTNVSLIFEWEPLVLPIENGALLKYDYKLEQLKYGDIATTNANPNWQGNVDSKTTVLRYDGLRPWSTYKFTIAPVNHIGYVGLSASTEVSTKESVPSKPPSNVHATVDATAIVLKWDHPPYDSRNGYIKEYEIGYKSMIEQRRRRNIQRYTTRTGTPSSFGCSQEQATCVVRFSGLNPYQKFAFRVAAKTVAGVGRYSDVRTFRTAQAASSAPLSPTNDDKKSTYCLMWKPPLKPNGVITEYEIEMKTGAKIRAVFTKNTFYDTKLAHPDTITFRVRAYTEFYHNKGGHKGSWTAWTIARIDRPYIKPEPEAKDNTTMIIGVSFTVIILLLIVAIIIIFFLYRRRQRSGTRRKLEVEMDSIADVDNENVHITSGEKTPLTQNLGSHEAVDISTEDHAHVTVPIDEFHVYVSRMREDDDELMTQQYKELMSGKCYSTEIGLRTENKPKNRYVNIAAYDHSRVILKPEGGKKIIHHRESDYFNANHIEGYCPQSSSKYIASQGPMDSVFADFWRMIWQENISVIIMLTNLEEGGKVKCDQYWPSHGACKYGHVTVRFIRSDQTADYFIRTFDIEKGIGKDKVKRTLMQFHFISWPDYGVPEFPTAILSLRRRVRHNYDGDAPILVHCSAGVGRTGCYILIDAMLERIDNGEGSLDIFNYLQYMRTRRINMVQTLDQYIFAHLSILEYLTFGDTEISVIDFERKLKDLQRANGIGNEFELIDSTSPDLESIDNSCKVLLNSGRFIDVFYVDGYKQRDTFLLCNSPSANMTPDIWKMIIEQSCHTIVMLNRLEDDDNHKYWPDMNTHYNYENYSVFMTSEQTNANIITRKFKITSSESPEEHFELQHFQFLDWPSEDIPKNRNSILTLMSLIEKSRQNYGNGPVLVHSGNGAGRSGTLVAIYNSTERLKVEQLIDIPQCVRAIRTVVPNAIGVKRQYEFIYEMIRTYLEAFETYSNFSDPTMCGEDA